MSIKNYVWAKEFKNENEVNVFMNSDIITKGYYYGIPKNNITIDGNKIIVKFKAMGRTVYSRIKTLDNLGFERFEAC